MLQHIDSLTLGLFVGILIFGVAAWWFAYGDGERGVSKGTDMSASNFFCTTITMGLMAFMLVMRTDLIFVLVDGKPFGTLEQLWCTLWALGLYMFPKAMTVARMSGYEQYLAKTSHLA